MLSKAYQKLQGRFRRDNSIKGFLNVGDTNIPSLKAFAADCTLADREKAADRILNEVNLFKVTLELWAENRGTKPQLTPEQRMALRADVEKHFKRLKEVSICVMNLVIYFSCGTYYLHKVAGYDNTSLTICRIQINSEGTP